MATCHHLLHVTFPVCQLLPVADMCTQRWLCQCSRAVNGRVRGTYIEVDWQRDCQHQWMAPYCGWKLSHHSERVSWNAKGKCNCDFAIYNRYLCNGVKFDNVVSCQQHSCYKIAFCMYGWRSMITGTLLSCIECQQQKLPFEERSSPIASEIGPFTELQSFGKRLTGVRIQCHYMLVYRSSCRHTFFSRKHSTITKMKAIGCCASICPSSQNAFERRKHWNLMTCAIAFTCVWAL